MANKSFYYPGVEKMYLFQRDGSENNPFLPLTQTSKVKYARVDLSEIPDFERKVTVVSSDGTSLIEVFTTDLSENEYLVDYSKGFVRFHPSQENNTFEISYLGMGRVNIPANRITIDTDESNEAELSVQELLDTQGNIGDRLTDAQNGINTLENLIEQNQVVKSAKYQADMNDVNSQISSKVNNGDFTVFKNATTTQLADESNKVAVLQRNFVSLLNYAVGDGYNDDTAGVQNAIDYIENTWGEKGGTIFVPLGGRFKISQVRVKSKHITFTGGGIIDGEILVKSVDRANPSADNNILDLFTVFDGVKFINSDNYSGKAGIRIQNTRVVSIRGCYFENYEFGILGESLNEDVPYQQTARVTINECKFYDVDYCVKTLWKPWYQGVAATWVYHQHGDWHVTECQGYFYNIGKTHVWMEGQDGLIISNNTFFHELFTHKDPRKEYNIYVRSCNFATISDNNLFEAGYESIKIDDPRVLNIHDNHIAWCGQRVPSSAISINNNDTSTYNSCSLKIDNNDISGTSRYGIELQARVIKAKVDGNNLYRLGTSDFYYGSDPVPGNVYSIVVFSDGTDFDSRKDDVFVTNNHSDKVLNIGRGIEKNNFISGDYSDAEINVKHLGIRGDKGFDVTNLIQNIIYRVPVGTNLFFPDNKYVVSSEILITKPLTIRGKARPTLGSDNNLNNGTYLFGAGFKISNANNVTIRNFGVQTTRANGFEIRSSTTNCLLENCISIATDHSFLIEEYGGTIERTVVRNCFSYDSVHGFVSKAKNTIFENCHAFRHTTQNGFAIVADNINEASQIATAIGNTIRDCTANVCSVGFAVYSRDYFSTDNTNNILLENIILSNCKSYNALNHGFYIGDGNDTPSGQTYNKVKFIVLENCFEKNSGQFAIMVNRAEKVSLTNFYNYKPISIHSTYATDIKQI